MEIESHSCDTAASPEAQPHQGASREDSNIETPIKRRKLIQHRGSQMICPHCGSALSDEALASADCAGSSPAPKETGCLESSASSAASTSRRFKELEKFEPLLMENPQRWVLFPIRYPEVYKMYKQHQACFWTSEEILLRADLTDWASLRESEQHFIKHILAFFAASDGIVLENLAARFSNEVQIPEARAFYGFQMAMENVHSETYSLLIDTYVKDPDEKHRVFNAVQTMPSVGRKARWAANWMSDERSFAERLVAFAAVEGILFSGAFCAIFWLKKRGLMPGLTFSNELISRDEGLHTDFACLLYSMLNHQLPDDVVHDIVRGAVDVEREFICEALPCNLIGMNSRLMAQYTEFVADRLLVALGHAKLYGSVNPFEWMELISMQGKTNFFEKKVSEYQRAGVMERSSARDDTSSATPGSPGDFSYTLVLDADF